MAEIIGIDLGTTKSACAIWRDGRPQLIPNAEGKYVTPSLVGFDRANERWVVGDGARLLGLEDPRATVSSIKRFMGRGMGDQTVQEDIGRYHILYDIGAGPDGRGTIEVAIGDRHLTPQEVSAKILQKLKSDAEAHLQTELTQAVITVPAYFNDAQRQATRDAGRIAGLDVRRILNEPTAACLAFGYTRLQQERKTVAVYDLGGGTFDVSILDVGRGPFWVRATNGDTHLGGNDLDWRIVEWIIGQLNPEEREVARTNNRARVRLRAAAEDAKWVLSGEGAERTPIAIPSLLRPQPEASDAVIELTRGVLDDLAREWIERTLEPCRQALHDASLKPSDITEVLLVGGQTRMPAIRTAVRELFGVEPNISINPEEAVALGAAVTAGILGGTAAGIKLADVVPLSLGVRTRGGKMDVLIARNTQVPITETRSYSTFFDNQESVDVLVYQGERPLASDNVGLGNFILSGIEPAPAGQPDIQVTFRVDENGILEVTGMDAHTGALQKIRISDSLRLSDDEIEAMIREAREHSAEDAARLQIAEARNQAELWRRQLADLVARRPTELPADLLAAIGEALSAMAPTDWVAYRAQLEQLWHRARTSADTT